MTTICLVRHGETEWNREGRIQGREDIELNETGRLQARRCADYLKQYQWDIVITSPLKRARETAEIINEQIGALPIIENAGYIERDYGKASGLLVQEKNQRYPDGIIEGQEDWYSLRERAMNALKETADKYQNMRIVVVSHGGLINSVLNTVSKGEIGSGKTFLKNACINVLKYESSDWKLELCNYDGHLE